MHDSVAASEVHDRYRKIYNVDGSVIELHILDTSLLDRSLNALDSWLQDTDGSLLVLPVTAEDALHYAECQYGRRLQDHGRTPTVIVGNKCDLDQDRRVSFVDAVRLAESLGHLPYYETNALDGSNVHAAFTDLYRQILRKRAFQPKKPGMPTAFESQPNIEETAEFPTTPLRGPTGVHAGGKYKWYKRGGASSRTNRHLTNAEKIVNEFPGVRTTGFNIITTDAPENSTEQLDQTA